MKSLALFVVVALALIGYSSGSCPNSSSCHSCPTGWIRWQNNCYKYHSELQLNFQEAEAACSEFVPFKETWSYQTAHLASIESAAENAFLLGEWKKVRGPVGNPHGEKVYIGYTDQNKEGSWQWLDRSSSCYTNWDEASTEPNNEYDTEDCAVMWNLHDDSGHWNDIPCSDRHSFFCKFRLF